MNRYTLHCTHEQTKKALELGAPIEFEMEHPVDFETWERSPYPDIKIGEDGEPILINPTAEQMIGWLEEKGISFDTEWSWNKQLTILVWDNPNRGHIYTSYNNSRKEATLSAIDAALEYLRKGGAE